MNFAAIIPDRNDRPALFDHCLNQISRMTLKPTYTFAISYPPESEAMDLTERVRCGIEKVQEQGIDLLFILENDDSYPYDYFEKFSPFFRQYEFFGDNSTTYYNLRNKTYRTWKHAGRASLFTTGFKISALDRFEWPPDNERFLDIKLWNYGRTRKHKFVDTGAIGIKHGQGMTGGKGHYMRFKNVDVDLKFLKEHCNGSFEFYEGLMKIL